MIRGTIIMGFFDTFKGNQYKAELEQLKHEHESLKALMTPEMQDAFMLKQEIDRLQSEQISHQKQIDDLNLTIASKNSDINALDNEIQRKKKEIVWMDDEILVQEFGLYKPQFEFASSLDYKEKLSEVRATQKELIKNKQAVTGNTQWEVNGSAAKGRKMVSDTQKLLLRAFNSECDELVSKVKYTNFDASLDKIYKSSEAISKLGAIMNISITQNYLNSKVKELRLAFEFQTKKQQEKEELKAARAEQREQAKIQKELEEQRRKIEKEQTHYQTAFEKLQMQLELNPDNPDLLLKKAELESQLSEIDKALNDVDYRQANMRAGYVYIISNIGAFGENVYKIGMTRRLEPQERIDELGDASVPFNFDVHAMIFSDDAPALEAALHRAFENRKLNMVNQRREFFNVTLDEIKEVVKKNFDKTVEFIDVPDAEQYRISMRMKEIS
uniref:Helicase n=2 Tax=root TaxID=1 RepID=A0A8S5Q6C0_9CAUD|nr:MAG TPA: helicase [Siphoviridae sp. ct8HH20]